MYNPAHVHWFHARHWSLQLPTSITVNANTYVFCRMMLHALLHFSISNWSGRERENRFFMDMLCLSSAHNPPLVSIWSCTNQLQTEEHGVGTSVLNKTSRDRDRRLGLARVVEDRVVGVCKGEVTVARACINEEQGERHPCLHASIGGGRTGTAQHRERIWGGSLAFNTTCTAQ